MRDGGLFLHALLAALALISLVGWGYFWLLCVNSAERLLKPLFGDAALTVACIGFPFAFLGVLYLVINNFNKVGVNWFFLIVGAALPILGIWAIKRDKW